MKKESKYNVSGQVTTNNLYCGGARPTKEMLAKLRIPITYNYKKFYLKKQAEDYSTTDILQSFSTDSLGSFALQLPTGKYAIFLEEQINEIDFSDFRKLTLDQSCYEEWLHKPFATFEVINKNSNELHYTIQKKCFIPYDIPCLEYTGPRPG